MVREHGSLTKDAETNQAAWEAVKGGAYGSIKVSWFARACVLRLCLDSFSGFFWLSLAFLWSSDCVLLLLSAVSLRHRYLSFRLLLLLMQRWCSSRPG